MAFEDQVVKYTQTVAELDAVGTTNLSDGQQASVENEGKYALDKTADGWNQTTLKAPYILSSYRGLKISEFLDSNEHDVDQIAQIGEALSALNSARYTSLALEGRTIGINNSLDMAQYFTGSNFYGHKIIKKTAV